MPMTKPITGRHTVLDGEANIVVHLADREQR